MGSSGCVTGPHLHYIERDAAGNVAPIPQFEGKRVYGSSPIKEADGYLTGDRYLSYNTPLLIYVPGNLIQAKGENFVYLVSIDNGNPARIVKRWITDETAFALNHFDWRRIIEIPLADKALYLRGDDITGKITVDGLREGELVRVTGDAVKVFVVSGGELHHLKMVEAEFSLLGYSFNQIREVDDVYPKGKEITYAAFVSTLAPILAGPGTTLTEVPGRGDPRRYDVDPLVLFFKDPQGKSRIVVASPEDVKFDFSLQP